MARDTTKVPDRVRNGRAADAAPAGPGEEHPPAVKPRRLVAAARTRRRPGLIGLGVAVIAVAALGVYLLVASMSQTTRVLVLTAPVMAGEQVQAGQLAAVDLTLSAQLAAVPASQMQDIVGQRATVPLLAGQLLPADAVTDSDLAPDDDNVLVGLPLTAAQLPTVPIQAGDEILVVDTPAAQGDPPAETPDAIAARVASRDTTEDGLIVLNLYAPVEQARDLAARAGTGRVHVILTRSASPSAVAPTSSISVSPSSVSPPPSSATVD